MALPSSQRLHFAYGSSLSVSEMQSRCPTSKFYGIAILRNHRWFINERGFANIVPSLPGPNGVEDIVWGILYTLRPFDEESLDKHEGLPWAYTKEEIDVELVSITEDGRGTKREVTRALVYIDRERLQEGYPWPDFVMKMNKGIQEAVERGFPRAWVDKVVRGYMVTPSSANGTEGQAKADGFSPVHNGALSQSTTRAGSDHASHTHESLVGGQVVDGGPAKGRPIYGFPSSGLEKSKYADEASMTMTHRGKVPDRREATANPKKPATSSTHSYGNKKLLECWWWRVKNSCNKSDDECAFAHYETGVAANAPGTTKRKVLAGEKATWGAPEGLERRVTNTTWGADAEAENSKDQYGYQQDWVSQQGRAEDWGAQQGKPEDRSVQQTKGDDWGAPQGRAETNTNGNEQVQNLMDSEPEWLKENQHQAVNW